MSRADDAAAYAAWKRAKAASAGQLEMPEAARPEAEPLEIGHTYSAPLITCQIGYDRSRVCEQPTASGPDDMARILRERIGEQDREHVAVLLLDTKHKPLGVHIVSIGTLSSATCDPRYVYRAAIVANAHTLVMSHNHPSGDPAPSLEDIRATQRMIESGQILGIEVLDHIIIGERDRYVSLRSSHGTLWTAR